ncbi:winged helix-turn-helix transcriptional regulator [Halorubellus sp. JP-L1]|uniref:ArsR/SmtB family transcription factor n=1 Tax=Halorubellus sp. JP-L1 TaxID=2715753 RepID=UPI00140A2F00|nr:metalloregulator ArsR/SmtB family transcription factor [Halorubellus sp. JP-L1]NHN41924.1 winged helix-turn-helix transcriptional regulator [Halorubellus sp. JP-L1]
MQTERLERFVAATVDECCGGDVTERRRELEGFAAVAEERTDSRDVNALRALADDTRYRIVRLLAAAGEELCVCEFAPLLSVSESAVSHALGDLTDAGLLTRRKDGRWRYYGPTPRARALLAALDETHGGER